MRKNKRFENVNRPTVSGIMIDEERTAIRDDALFTWKNSRGEVWLDISIANTPSYLNLGPFKHWLRTYGRISDSSVYLNDHVNARSGLDMGRARFKFTLTGRVRVDSIGTNPLDFRFLLTHLPAERSYQCSYKDATEVLKSGYDGEKLIDINSNIKMLVDSAKRIRDWRKQQEGGVSEDDSYRWVVQEHMILCNYMAGLFAFQENIPVLYMNMDRGHSGVTSSNNELSELANFEIKRLGSSYYDSAPKGHDALGLLMYSPISSPLRDTVSLINQYNISHVINKKLTGTMLPFDEETLKLIANKLNAGRVVNRTGRVKATIAIDKRLSAHRLPNYKKMPREELFECIVSHSHSTRYPNSKLKPFLCSCIEKGDTAVIYHIIFKMKAVAGWKALRADAISACLKSSALSRSVLDMLEKDESPVAFLLEDSQKIEGKWWACRLVAITSYGEAISSPCWALSDHRSKSKSQAAILMLVSLAKGKTVPSLDTKLVLPNNSVMAQSSMTIQTVPLDGANYVAQLEAAVRQSISYTSCRYVWHPKISDGHKVGLIIEGRQGVESIEVTATASNRDDAKLCASRIALGAVDPNRISLSKVAETAVSYIQERVSVNTEREGNHWVCQLSHPIAGEIEGHGVSKKESRQKAFVKMYEYLQSVQVY